MTKTEAMKALLDLGMRLMFHRSVKLGKNSQRVDNRTLKLAKYIKALPPPPTTMGYIQKVANWPMMLNDSLGDCTCACAGHEIEQWTRYAGKPFTPSDAQILAAYEAVSGYNPNVPNSDNGAVVLDVLNYWRKTGIGDHKIVAYASIDPSNLVEFEQAVAIFGNVYLGVGLPITAQDPRHDENGLPIWEVVNPTLKGNAAPWSWGGHAIPMVGYKSHTAANGGGRVVSWGGLYDVTWAFIKSYCDEAYAIVTQDWIEANEKSPSGFDIATLLADLNQIV